MSVELPPASVAAPVWVHARGEIRLDVPRVMAVVNLTPDSFFDGGNLLPPGRDDPNAAMAVRRCLGLVQDGADILDLGGESTRPGAEPVAPEIELRRVLPVLRRLVADPALARVPISLDTRNAAVARAGMLAGAAIINDVSGLADPAMAVIVAETGAGLVVGHLRGVPADMQRSIAFTDVLAEVSAELARVVERALRAGVAGDRIVVDPGIGFGKTAEQSAALVGAAFDLAQATGCPVLVGASRKAFLGVITGRTVEERMIASVAAAVVAVERGASVVRVHDVGPTAEALRVSAAVRRAYVAAHAAPPREGP
jgi:dihydropteroate synthase